jgi:hypothetical protein
VNAIKSNVVAQDDRRSRRTEICIDAIVDAGPGRQSSVVVLNVSAHGVMARTVTSFVPGRPVTLTAGALAAVPGRIAWQRDGHVGIAFSEPLTIAQIDAIG